MTEPPAVADLRSRLDTALGGAARAWLDQAVAEAVAAAGSEAVAAATSEGAAAATSEGAAEAAGEAVAEAVADGVANPTADARAAAPPSWELRFAEAGRRCGPEHADAARLLLLHAARADTATLTRLYDQGTAAERRAVLRCLPLLVPGPEALPLVDDALRTNDTRLLAAALGPYAAAHLPAHAWRHAVLKCLFTEVPVDAVADLERRAHADDELARMLADYADERAAAGRPVPGDLHRVLALAAPPDLPAPRLPERSDLSVPPDRQERPDRPDPAAAVAVTAPSTPIGEEQES
ncbi:EboA domain-containing protein [Streptomyces sp. NRRL B-1347]|uniref:EboA domain-containing protein n=1 Tax=Streptomyces sp. NRRL B-1347 TaxID=1476877 RepID=UPI0004C93971|nr:EboA domain-containing protein [Streptomyces sp. NRRL B-1347]